MKGKKQLREVITVKGWQTGGGWSYEECFSDKTVDADEANLFDWDWWETENEIEEETDTFITVNLYDLDADVYVDQPLISHSIWQSDLVEMRKGKGI